MTVPAPDYDDVAGRTRQSWLRTSLGSAAVILLVERGLLVSTAPAWLRGLGLLPAVLLLAVALVRMRQIGGGATAHPARRSILLFVAGVVGLTMVAAVAVVVTVS